MSFRFKSTTSMYVTTVGQRISCYMWKDNEQVADRVWRPMTPGQRANLEAGYSAGSASDYAVPQDLSGFTECRLVLFGDAYTCSVWEVR